MSKITLLGGGASGSVMCSPLAYCCRVMQGSPVNSPGQGWSCDVIMWNLLLATCGTVMDRRTEMTTSDLLKPYMVSISFKGQVESCELKEVCTIDNVHAYINYCTIA